MKEKVITDLEEFREQVPVLMPVLMTVDGVREGRTHLITPKHYPDLLRSDEGSSHLHVLSYDGTKLYNRFVPNMPYYFYGEGNGDPELVLMPKRTTSEFLAWVDHEMLPVAHVFKKRVVTN